MFPLDFEISDDISIAASLYKPTRERLLSSAEPLRMKKVAYQTLVEVTLSRIRFGKRYLFDGIRQILIMPIPTTNRLAFSTH